MKTKEEISERVSSFGMNELEAVHSKKAKPDMERYKAFLTDMLERPQMNTEKIIDMIRKNEQVTLTDIDAEDMLYEVCDREHSSCNDDCPIYFKILTSDQKKASTCPYHKKGHLMLKALRGEKVFKINVDKKNYLVNETNYVAIIELLKGCD